MNRKTTQSMSTIENKIMNRLHQKYSAKEYQFSYISINNLIFQISSRVVAVFKDFLILDDPTEFLRRFYKREESHPRLQKILNFFETYSKIFPNYMVLPESEYLYKNIRKKQKMIDAVNEIKREEEENRKQIGKNKKNANNHNINAVFTAKIQNSINRYQPSVTIDDSFDNSISISIVSKRFKQSPENSFLKENETNISLLDILSGMEPQKQSREITVKQKKNTNYINNILETPHKQKKFIQKIISPSEPSSLSNASKSKSQKFISTLVSNSNPHSTTCSSGHFNVINNYQNIFLPQGNTVININNNYFNCNQPTKEIKVHGGILSPQPSMRTNTIYKNKKNQKSIKNFKSPIKSKEKTLTERTKSSAMMKTATIYQRKNNTLLTQKNNTLVAKIDRKNSNPKIHSRVHQNNLLNNEGYKSQGLLAVNVMSPKKADTSKDKMLSSAMKTKYKAFLKRIKMNSLANRNSVDTYISSNKSKKCFTSIFSNSTVNKSASTHKNMNTCKNFASQKNLSIKKENVLTRSAAFSPTNSTSNKVFASFEPHTPITQKIRVNRKNYFEKLKKNESMKKDYQTYENKI